MSHKTSRRGMLAVATAAGAVLAAALIPVATAPSAGADDGPIDTFQDMLIGQAPGGEGGLIDISDILTGEGTPFDQTVDSFYAQVDQFLDMFIKGADPLMMAPASTAVPADSPIDTFQDMLIGQAPGGEGGLIDISDFLTGEGTPFDHLVDGFYAQMDQFLDLFIHGADPLMMF